MRSARPTLIIGAVPKALLPFIIIVPGMIGAVLIPNLGAEGGPEYNNTLSLLIGQLLPNGMLGIAITAEAEESVHGVTL